MREAFSTQSRKEPQSTLRSAVYDTIEGGFAMNRLDNCESEGER